MKSKVPAQTQENPAVHERADNGEKTPGYIKRFLGVAAIAGAVALAAGADKDSSSSNIQSDNQRPIISENSEIAPSNSALGDINLTEVGQAIVDGMRTIGPIALGLGGLTLAGMRLSRNSLNKAKLSLANRGYLYDDSNRLRKFFKGAIVPAIGAIALTTSLSIEKEIREGPNRVIENVESRFAVEYPDSNLYWLLEPGTDHLMNNSKPLSVETNNSLDILQINSDKVELLPFKLELTNAENDNHSRTSLLLAAPNVSEDSNSLFYPEVKNGALCQIIEGTCELKDGELIVDSGEGMELGDTVSIRGSEFKVAGLAKEPQSLLNRLVIYTNESSMDALRVGSESPYYGILSVAASRQEIDNLLRKFELENNFQILSTEQLVDRNDDFWEGNGTALVMLLIINITAFGGISMYERKRVEQEQSRRDLATLRAIGFRPRDLAQVEAARSTMSVGKAAAIAYPVALGVSAVANAGIIGFNSVVDVPMLASAAGTVLAAKLAGDAWLAKKIREISPAEHINQ